MISGFCGNFGTGLGQSEGSLHVMSIPSGVRRGHAPCRWSSAHARHECTFCHVPRLQSQRCSASDFRWCVTATAVFASVGFFMAAKASPHFVAAFVFGPITGCESEPVIGMVGGFF